ncbi:hypothetical protein [Cytobacillus oceanisediminis]|uniref:hypothetical protein n=1 Tax=Cytobacillus oceanisediminis TaxID=665099 RepID=UPI001FB5000D|nr:hypothetical protein [Cytobacillus oceanisediminis]UOE53332.1 hypothetical protein IRB79_15595 [Cytobacillus oceanisediminis]
MEYFTSWAWLKGFLIIENADDGIFAWFGFLEVIIAEWGCMKTKVDGLEGKYSS